MGAGVGAAALMLYLTGAWVVIAEDATDRIVRENHAAALASRFERRSRPRPVGRARPVHPSRGAEVTVAAQSPQSSQNSQSPQMPS
jgi:hypothetical protein